MKLTPHNACMNGTLIMGSVQLYNDMHGYRRKGAICWSKIKAVLFHFVAPHSLCVCGASVHSTQYILSIHSASVAFNLQCDVGRISTPLCVQTPTFHCESQLSSFQRFSEQPITVRRWWLWVECNRCEKLPLPQESRMQLFHGDLHDTNQQRKSDQDGRREKEWRVRTIALCEGPDRSISSLPGSRMVDPCHWRWAIFCHRRSVWISGLMPKAVPQMIVGIQYFQRREKSAVFR